ncbi:MAG: hypothetical protein ACYSWP_01510, partial [Planctomycetota bacterium]
MGTDSGAIASSWFRDGQKYYIHKARVGIHMGCDQMGLRQGDEILMPAYNCGTEVDVFLNKGVCVVLYRVHRDGKINLDDL